MNPLEHEKAIRKAGAAKAQILLSQRDRDSDVWQEAMTDVSELGGRDALIEYVVAEDAVKIRESREAELCFAEEWKKDGYLEGLREAWDKLSDVYAEDPENEEASRVFLELKRFADQVDAEVESEVEGLKRDLADVPLEELQEKVIDRVLDLRAGLAWLREYRRCEIFFSVRDPEDHNKHYFLEREDVDRLSVEVFRKLAESYEDLMVAPTEGKDSGKTPTSLPSSEPPNEEETPASSGLQVAAP